jgi:hypothetical protein
MPDGAVGIAEHLEQMSAHGIEPVMACQGLIEGFDN